MFFEHGQMFKKSFIKSGNIKTNLHAERPLSISYHITCYEFNNKALVSL